MTKYARTNLTFYVCNEQYYPVLKGSPKAYNIKRALGYLIDDIREEISEDYHDKTDRRKIYLWSIQTKEN